jgi:chromosome segregation ATPase
VPATTGEDGGVGQALKLAERMSDDIGMLIGAARWLAKEAAQAKEARAEARRLIGELNDAQDEIHRLNKRVERERKGSKRLAAELGEKTRALDSLARLRDEVEVAGWQVAKRLARELKTDWTGDETRRRLRTRRLLKYFAVACSARLERG